MSDRDLNQGADADAGAPSGHPGTAPAATVLKDLLQRAIATHCDMRRITRNYPEAYTAAGGIAEAALAALRTGGYAVLPSKDSPIT